MLPHLDISAPTSIIPPFFNGMSTKKHGKWVVYSCKHFPSAGALSVTIGPMYPHSPYKLTSVMISLARSRARSGETKHASPFNATPASYMFWLLKSCTDDTQLSVTYLLTNNMSGNTREFRVLCSHAYRDVNIRRRGVYCGRTCNKLFLHIL